MYMINPVEIFHWGKRTWSPLQSMVNYCWRATSFIHDDHMIIAGGYYGWSSIVDDMVRTNIGPNPDLTDWSDCPVKTTC